jgi:hypothetical protein
VHNCDDLQRLNAVQCFYEYASHDSYTPICISPFLQPVTDGLHAKTGINQPVTVSSGVLFCDSNCLVGLHAHSFMHNQPTMFNIPEIQFSGQCVPLHPMNHMQSCNSCPFPSAASACPIYSLLQLPLHRIQMIIYFIPSNFS